MNISHKKKKGGRGRKKKKGKEIRKKGICLTHGGTADESVKRNHAENEKKHI